jgi:hypothetical protein
MLIQEREKYAADKLAIKQKLVDDLSDALLELHRRADSLPPLTVPVPAKLCPVVGLRPRTRFRRVLRRLALL